MVISIRKKCAWCNGTIIRSLINSPNAGGKEYLRIIYSPDYDSDENLSRLRNRSLGRKRSLALR
ncbi:MAG: hypothetical protein KDA84_23450, partial [Planctomycetaceae bacterium]|nr:hypothetical protein [Planctomycetaceae bacterium]